MVPVLAFAALLILGAVWLIADTWTEACSARRLAESNSGELRALRIQLSNAIQMLQHAGFKLPRQQGSGWEDDFHATRLRDSEPPEFSWWNRPHERGYRWNVRS